MNKLYLFDFLFYRAEKIEIFSINKYRIIIKAQIR